MLLDEFLFVTKCSITVAVLHRQSLSLRHRHTLSLSLSSTNNCHRPSKGHTRTQKRERLKRFPLSLPSFTAYSYNMTRPVATAFVPKKRRQKNSGTKNRQMKLAAFRALRAPHAFFARFVSLYSLSLSLVPAHTYPIK